MIRPAARAALWGWAKAEGIASLLLPLVLFYAARGRLGAGGALVLASLAPLLALAVGLVRERRVRPLPLLVAGSALLGAALAWAFRDARAIVFKDAAVDSLWGVAFVVLALLPALPLHRLAAPIAPLLRPGAGPEDWNRPSVSQVFRRLLFLWAAQSFLLAASKLLALSWFGLDGYLPAAVSFRIAVQAAVMLYSLARLRRALKEV